MKRIFNFLKPGMKENITPKIGEGIFLTKDVSEILRLPYWKVNKWLNQFWDGRLSPDFAYSFGVKRNKAINFYTLIEFYTFYKLREFGISAQKIQSYHKQISKELNTLYPFARNIQTDGKNLWYEHLGELIKADGKLQFDFKKILSPFLEKIDFGNNELAERYFPLGKEKNVVVDPHHQFGQPVIKGTNIKTQTLFGLYKGGETIENISTLYNISKQKVKDAIRYQNAA